MQTSLDTTNGSFPGSSSTTAGYMESWRSNSEPAGSRPSPQSRSCCAMAVPARSSPTPPTPPSAQVTAWRWPTGQVRRSRTWSSSNTIPPGSRSRASSLPRRRAPKVAGCSTRTATATSRTTTWARLSPRQCFAAWSSDRGTGCRKPSCRKSRRVGPSSHPTGRSFISTCHLGAKLIDTKLPMVRELCLKYERIDPVKDLIPVRPVVHYMMGGVHTDINGATPIEGLFAAGETACVTINGANRLGSNSLPECLVFGARAGRAAAEYASSAQRPPPVVMQQVEDEIRRIDQMRRPDRGSERIADIREEMQSTMEDSAGIFRSGESLSKGSDRLAELQQRLERVQLHDETQVFNTELVTALELANMLDIAETILQSALQREESRGAHQRTDFTARDDTRFLDHALAYRDADGAVRIERSPVTITRWPPGERVYGR